MSCLSLGRVESRVNDEEEGSGMWLKTGAGVDAEVVVEGQVGETGLTVIAC